MSSFNVGDLVLMGEKRPVLTVQFIRDESVICSYLDGGRIHTIELNPDLLKLAPSDFGKPADIPISFKR
jgi:hypothetical protein